MATSFARVAYRIGRLASIALLALSAVALIAGGSRLLVLGGSPYYLGAGLAYAALAVLLFAGSRRSLLLSTAIFATTVVWALIEVGGIAYWPLLPRLVFPALLYLLSLWLTSTFAAKPPPARRWSRRIALATFAALLATLIGAFFPHGAIRDPAARAASAPAPADAAQPDDWAFFGRSTHGTRYAPYTQITPDNVRDLQVAWTYRTGRETRGSASGVDQNTPLQIGNVLYSCTPQNIVTALDADTGQPLWRFDPHARSAEHVSCRGVGYHDLDADTSLTAEDRAAYTHSACRRRILVSTVDARLIALDAASGNRCPGFGENGSVDLTPRMGPVEGSRRYHPTSIPVVMGHLAVIGGWVRDIEDGEPSGAVRAFDVRDGSLV